MRRWTRPSWIARLDANSARAGGFPGLTRWIGSGGARQTAITTTPAHRPGWKPCAKPSDSMRVQRITQWTMPFPAPRSRWFWPHTAAPACWTHANCRAVSSCIRTAQTGSERQRVVPGLVVAVVSGREDLDEGTPLRRGDQQLKKQRQGHGKQLDDNDAGVAQCQAQDARNDRERNARQQEHADNDQEKPENGNPVDHQRAQAPEQCGEYRPVPEEHQRHSEIQPAKHQRQHCRRKCKAAEYVDPL